MNRAARRRDAAIERANEKMRTLISTGRLAAFARETQAEVDAWQSANMPERPVSCSEGCAACCYLPIHIEIAEAHNIVRLFPEEIARALPLLIEQEEQLGKAIALQDFRDLPDPDRGEAANQRIASAYTDLRLRCPFLGDDDRCRIYEARPIPCRTHFAFGDPADCVDGHAKQLFWNTPERLGAPVRLMERVAREQDGKVTVGLLQSLVLAAAKRQAQKHR